MRNFKTTKGYKVVIDYMDWYYTWKEIRNYYDLDEQEVYICFPWDSDIQSIMDIDIPQEWVRWLLRRKLPKEYSKENLPRWDQDTFENDFEWRAEYFMKEYWDYEKDYEIRPFYISYYGWWNFRLQFCEAQEGSWIMLIKRRKIWMKAAEEIIKTLFEHYIEWGFLYYQVYSPHNAYFEEWELRTKRDIKYYDYEDWCLYFTEEEDILKEISESYWEILKETESDHLETRELIKKPDN